MWIGIQNLIIQWSFFGCYMMTILSISQNFMHFIYFNTYQKANSYIFSNPKQAREKIHMTFVSTKEADLG